MKTAVSSLLFLLIIACKGGDDNKNEGIRNIKDLKTRQYAIQGQQLYLQYCSNCHQEDGTGLNRLIPPLKNADYMLNDVNRSLYIIKNGMKGSIKVNGVEYNQPMPENSKLSPIEIAQVATYIYNVWGNEHGLITPEKVKEALSGTP
ncbi:MAG: cytochrome c [Cytophagales bacterium]|uniref:c-type cytochrome n=1 Tax=Cyclobacterium marinum TaxID=104 RepID=UPI0030DA6105|nr:cytochrome c [Cytophagales bacterium]|tara:strand:- start:60995 stop:61435 length:441 start_codon:yes stop_codon:yes gene_type:complete